MVLDPALSHGGLLMPRRYHFDHAQFQVLLAWIRTAARVKGLSDAEFVVSRVGVYKPTWYRWMAASDSGATVGVEEANLELLGKALDLGGAESTYEYVLHEVRECAPSQHPGLVQFEQKSVIPRTQLKLSRRLLDLREGVPSLANIVELIRPVTITEAEKDIGMLGRPAYTHIVQLSLIVSVHTKEGLRLLCCERRFMADSGSHRRTLGRTVLFTKPMLHSHKDAWSALDAWVSLVRRRPSDAATAALEPWQGRPAMPISVLRDQIRVPFGVVVKDVSPAFVISNDQRGKLHTKGHTMQTVYTSYVFHARMECTTQFHYSPERFRSPWFDQHIGDIVAAVSDEGARALLVSPKDGRLNVMDFLAAMALQSNNTYMQCDSAHGNAQLRRGFDLS